MIVKKKKFIHCDSGVRDRFIDALFELQLSNVITCDFTNTTEILINVYK